MPAAQHSSPIQVEAQANSHQAKKPEAGFDSWATLIGILAAIVGIILAWYGMSSPDIRAIHSFDGGSVTLETYDMTLKHGDTAVYRIAGTVRFRNYSMRHGGLIKEIHVIDDGPLSFGSTRLVDIDKVVFGPYSTHDVAFTLDNVVKWDPDHTQQASVLLQFEDQDGRSIRFPDGEEFLLKIPLGQALSITDPLNSPPLRRLTTPEGL